MGDDDRIVVVVDPLEPHAKACLRLPGGDTLGMVVVLHIGPAYGSCIELRIPRRRLACLGGSRRHRPPLLRVLPNHGFGSDVAIKRGARHV